MEDKRRLRTGLLHARGLRTAEERAAAGRSLAEHGAVATQGCVSVAAHVGVASEPPTRGLLEALHMAGVRVLVPRVDGTALAWGEFSSWDALRRNRSGLLEPAGTSDAWAAAAASADLVVVPALAVDRNGHRLGRGGGFYDRWLASAEPGRVLAVVYDDEVLDHVPCEPHDRVVDGALTPSGVVALRQ